ncbi:MAG: hypothetical protein R3B47_03120 [Bacteroidia bacterium]
MPGISPGFQVTGLHDFFADTVLDQCGNYGVIGSGGYTFRVLASLPAMRFATNFCSSSRINAKISGEVMCNSVQASDFRVVGPTGTIYNVATATGVNCERSQRRYTADSNPPLPGRWFYTVELVGTLLDSCGNESILSASTAFVSLPIIQPIAAPDTVCAGLPVTLDAGITGPFRFQWAPANVRARVATVFPNNSTRYSVTATDTLTGCIITPGRCRLLSNRSRWPVSRLPALSVRAKRLF